MRTRKEGMIYSRSPPSTCTSPSHSLSFTVGPGRGGSWCMRHFIGYNSKCPVNLLDKFWFCVCCKTYKLKKGNSKKYTWNSNDKAKITCMICVSFMVGLHNRTSHAHNLKQ